MVSVAYADPAPDDQTWFQRGDSFHYSSMCLEDLIDSTQTYTLPMIVLKAFSSEAYLKSLLMVEGREPPKIHHLLQLFDMLDIESKKRIRGWWGKQNLHKLATMKKAKVPGYRPPKTFRGALAASSNAFIEWRYVGAGSTIAYLLFSFPLDVRRRILELRPTWAPPVGSPLAILGMTVDERIKRSAWTPKGGPPTFVEGLTRGLRDQDFP
jgi:hypothetical protein